MLKTIKLFLILFFYPLCGYCQISFEKGYIVTIKDEKITCEIKNLDWRNHPKELKYKLSSSSSVNRIGIDSIKEFGINQAKKMIKARVNIDISNNNISTLTRFRAPIFLEEEVLLNVLVEGNASLFSYQSNGLTKFFYSIDGSKIKQLIFKKYINSKKEIVENNSFRQQLRNDLKCQSIYLFQVEKLRYSETNLVELFTLFNSCDHADYTNYEQKKEKDLFNLNIRPGLSTSSLSLNYELSNTGDVNFDGGLFFRYAIESEFVMPFSKNKWSVIFEPIFSRYESLKFNDFFLVNADYKSFEISIGLRHYLFLNDNSKVFFNINYYNVVATNSYIRFNDAVDLQLESGSRLKLVAGNNFAFGVGYKKNRSSVEFRYGHNRELLTNNFDWNATYRTYSLIMGYSIF
ncbi:MAG: hypothetical protein ACJA2S_003010 [Cyclobacteriaceae bacterium]